MLDGGLSTYTAMHLYTYVPIWLYSYTPMCLQRPPLGVLFLPGYWISDAVDVSLCRGVRLGW